MDAALTDRLTAIEPEDWFNYLNVSADDFLRIGIAVVDTLIPDWNTRNPQDTVPPRAIEAAKSVLADPSDGLRSHAKVLAKCCSDSRKKSLGIVEAARAIANAAVARSPERRIENTAEALHWAEDHLKYMYSIDAIYGKEPEIRRSFLAAIERARAQQGGAGNSQGAGP